MQQKAKTIEQFKILLWVDSNFYPGSVSIRYTDSNTAEIMDASGESMKIRYTDANGIEEL